MRSRKRLAGSRKNDDHAELQTLDLRALASVVGGDDDADRDLLVELGAANRQGYDFCASQVQGKLGRLMLHPMAECMRRSEQGARWAIRNLVSSMKN